LEDSDILKIYKEEGRQEFAFNLLVQKYSERIYWHIRGLTCSHEDSNDLLQTTLIKIWKHLPDFREESKLYTWIYKIATNETLTFLKKKRLSSAISLSNYQTVLENKLESDTSFNGDKLQMALQKAIIKLPDKQRAVFNLRYFKELKYEEISQIMGSSVGALKASYHHAYQKIKAELEEQFND
jgi:RNA polymerase sigma factor, sigma-70 family